MRVRCGCTLRHLFSRLDSRDFFYLFSGGFGRFYCDDCVNAECIQRVLLSCLDWRCSIPTFQPQQKSKSYTRPCGGYPIYHFIFHFTTGAMSDAYLYSITTPMAIAHVGSVLQYQSHSLRITLVKSMFYSERFLPGTHILCNRYPLRCVP